MALDAIVESLDNVPEAIQSEYVETENGYILDVKEVNGVALEDVNGLKKALSSERASVKTLKSENNKFKKDYEGVDIESLQTKATELADITAKYEALAALDPEAEADKLAKAKADKTVKTKQKEWQQLHDAEVSKHNETVTSLTDKTTVLEKQLHNVLVRNTAVESLTKEGVGDNLELVLPQMLNQVKYEVTEAGFDTYVADSDGNPRVKSDGTNMGVNDLVEELKGKWPNMFAIKAKPGGGKPPGGGGGAIPKGEMSATDKINAGLAARK